MLIRVCGLKNLIWDKEDKILTQEASSLDFPINVFPDIIKVQGHSMTIDFKKSFTNFIDNEITRVEYLPTEYRGVKKLIVFND